MIPYSKMRVLQSASEISNHASVLVPNTGLAVVVEYHGNQRGVRGVHHQSFGGVPYYAFVNAQVGAVQVNVDVSGILYRTPHDSGLGSAGAIDVGVGLLHLAEAHGREGVVVAAVSEVETVPAAHLAVQGGKDDAVSSRAHGVKHTALAASVANVKRCVYRTLNGVARRNGELGRATIHLHVT